MHLSLHIIQYKRAGIILLIQRSSDGTIKDKFFDPIMVLEL